MNPAWPSSASKRPRSRRKAQPCPSARRSITTPSATPSGGVWARGAVMADLFTPSQCFGKGWGGVTLTKAEPSDSEGAC